VTHPFDPPTDHDGFAGARVPDPPFAGDDGIADPALTAALAAGEPGALQAALLRARVFVALVAVLGEAEVGPDGLAREKTSDVRVVTVRRPDGAVALPVFSSPADLSRWHPAARPLPVAGVRAAQAAYTEGAVALLVDPGSAASGVLFGPHLRALAEARAWLPPATDPDVHAAVAEHVPAGLDWTLDATDANGGTDGADAVLRLRFPTGTPVAEARERAAALAGELAALPLLRARLVAGLDVRVEVAPPP